MAYNSAKHFIGLNGEGYTISQRGGKRYYQKKRAPTFVNKFGGGDSSYRDASFWQYFVQTNWRNGSKQLKFDDAGKFWKSSNVDTSILEQLTLSKELTSAGQIAADVNVNTIASWRADAGSSSFGTGSDGALTISADTTDAPIDSAFTGTAGSTSGAATNASFAAGQICLIIQSTGTGCGNKEERTIASYTAGAPVFTQPLTNTYVTGAQMVVLKQYTTVTINSTKVLTAKAWNGTTGGILGFKCSVGLTGTGTIRASGTSNGGTNSGGYRGGADVAFSDGHAGEGTTAGNTLVQITNNTNGGGGAKASPATGGAGGGNGTAGTNGSGATPSTGGTAVGSSGLTQLFFGGGGGGTDGNGGGGNGGGIIYIYAKTITITGSMTVNGYRGDNGGGGNVSGAGGGAGGTILLRCQTATLGTNLVTASGGAGGAQSGSGQAGGAGGSGIIRIEYSTSYTGTTTPTLVSAQDASLVDTPASTTSTAYAGGSNGKIYSWDNATLWTEVYDTRKLTSYDDTSLHDANLNIGDVGGVETAQAQGFQLAAATTVKSIAVPLKKNTGTPGDITVRIETDTAGKPSGTLANANATATISAFTSTTYAWVTVEFTTAFSLSATTQYHIVLKTAAAANDNYYAWQADGSSPTYTSGSDNRSTDGGSTWTIDTGTDLFFRVYSATTSVNCSLVTKVGGTKKIYFGTGNPTGTVNGDARLYSFDGTTWALAKTFATATESVINSISEFADGKVYFGIGPQGKVYVTSDFSTYTISKDIDIPQNPGYVYAIKEYNSSLYVGGGSPELVPTQYYNGFLNYYNQTTWNILYPYDYTVIKSMEFYDSYLFIGTYHGHLSVFDTSSLNPLFNFKEQYDWTQQVYCMKYFDDKLYIGLYPQDGTSDTNAGVWVFERHGLTNAHVVSGVTGYRCFEVVNGDLLIGTGNNGYVYKLSTTTYVTQGWYQSSYFDANLPSIDKLYNAITIKHDALVSGQSVVVYYRFSESASWTTLGTSNTVGATEKTISFPSGTYSKKITLKVELNTTTTTGTPKLTETIMQYTLYPARKWMWTMRLMAKKDLQLKDRTTDSRTAAQLRSALEDLMSTQSLYAYIDIDGTSYNVLVNEIDQSSWVIQQDSANEDEVIITLIEA